MIATNMMTACLKAHAAGPKDAKRVPQDNRAETALTVHLQRQPVIKMPKPVECLNRETPALNRNTVQGPRTSNAHLRAPAKKRSIRAPMTGAMALNRIIGARMHPCPRRAGLRRRWSPQVRPHADFPRYESRLVASGCVSALTWPAFQSFQSCVYWRNPPNSAIVKTKGGTMAQKTRHNGSEDGLVEVCRIWHIRKLSLFGSVLRDDFGPDSDVDVLVEFETGHTPSLFSLERLRVDLSRVFEGRKIDLFTPRSLHPRLEPSIRTTARVQFVAPP